MIGRVLGSVMGILFFCMLVALVVSYQLQWVETDRADRVVTTWLLDVGREGIVTPEMAQELDGRLGDYEVVVLARRRLAPGVWAGQFGEEAIGQELLPGDRILVEATARRTGAFARFRHIVGGPAPHQGGGEIRIQREGMVYGAGGY